MKIGLIGGSFDPIHYGHLLIAEEVREEYDLQKVFFMPAKIPPHKRGRQISPADKRYEMVRLCTERNDKFDVSDLELKREGVSYTIDTILKLKEIYGPGTEIYFISGADTIFNLETWMTVDRLLKEVVFVGTVRPGFDKDALQREAERLSAKYDGDVRILEIPLLEISSTMIRERIREGRSARYLLPGNVLRYIKENNLYV